ncbi:MAG: DNA polymerase bacteriophage-type [Microgenomates group bacterium Gr01-1014_16]|nr:MAG: DNA polymerase bacteriophage-type [Microgenomates group bacterium Gr01-1014_16]
MTISEKQQQLNKIAEEIKAFKGLEIAKNSTHAVPGEGDPNAQIMMVGEAPGQLENSTGRPFVGQSGQLMRKTLTETTGITPEEVFITNIVKFRPPDNRDPTPDEIEVCRDWLDRQINIIQPKIICTLGRFSMAKFIPDVSISRVHGQPRFVEFLGQKYIIFPMYHPAAALRGTTVLNEFKQDFVKLKNMLNPVSMPQNIPEEKPIITQPSLF